jgi:hypothetical protein
VSQTQQTCQRELTNQLATLLAWAATPLVLVVVTTSLDDGTAVDWRRLMPVLAPVMGGFVLAAALLICLLRLCETSAAKIVWTIGFCIASPMAASATGVALHMSLSVMSFGSIGGDVGAFAVFALMPMLIVTAPSVYVGTVLALAVLTGLLLRVARKSASSEPTTRASAS